MELLEQRLGPAAHISAWEESATGLVARLAAQRAYNGQVLINHDTPLLLVRTEGVQAELEYRNDRYGYLVWELRLRGEAPGGLLELHVVPPPPAPTPNTPEEYAAFRREFDARPSRPPDEPAAFPAWQKDYRERLWTWLMNGHPKKVPPQVRWELVEEQETFRLERLTYRSRKDRFAVSLLALPKGSARPVPLILALHGHETTWGQAVVEAFRPGHVDDFCHHFASHGYAVLQPPTMDHILQDERWTLYGEWLWDAFCGLDVALARPEVDPRRVGVVGLSTGGRLAQLVLAMDERVRAGVVAGIMGTRHHFRRHFRIPPHCDCGQHKYLDPHLEQCDLAALAAPKPVQIQHGREDHVMVPGGDPSKINLAWNTGVLDPAEFEAAMDEVRRTYRLCGAEGRITVHYHPGGHAVDNAAALAWISQYL